MGYPTGKVGLPVGLSCTAVGGEGRKSFPEFEVVGGVVENSYS